jgi:glycosyltransferase involved in cell wall biosynthesis
MKISIIVACLNTEASIGRCLDSVAGQDYADIEVVVADGGSRDRTVDILRRRGTEMGKRLIWFSEPDRGIADAWNKAVARSSGDWLLFLGADDQLAARDVLSRVAPSLVTAPPRYRIVYGRVEMVKQTGEVLELVDRPWSAKNFRSCQFCLPSQAVFLHRSLFSDGRGFDEGLKIASDYDFFLRQLMQSEPLYIPDTTITYMHIGGLSTSRQNAPKMWTELIQLHSRHVGGFPRHLYWELFKSLVALFLYKLGGDRLALPVTNFYRRLAGGRPPLQY